MLDESWKHSEVFLKPTKGLRTATNYLRKPANGHLKASKTLLTPSKTQPSSIYEFIAQKPPQLCTFAPQNLQK